MCSAFFPGCGYDNSTINFLGDVFCANTECSCKRCLLKMTFQSLDRGSYQCSQCASVCQVRNIPFEDQKISFLLSFGQGVYILKERPKADQDITGDV